MKRLGVWVLGLVLLAVSCWLLAGMPFDSNYQWADYHGWGTGGLNRFSTTDNLSNIQAVDMVNLLFEGSHVRARKGVDKMNTTSKGIYPALGVYELKKSSGMSQYLMVYNGGLWLFDDDIEEFSTPIKEFASTDSCVVTNGSALVKGATTAKTNFRDLGYGDSLSIYLGDTLRYMKRILSDSLFYLYTPWGGSTDSLIITVPFRISTQRLTSIDIWLNNLYITGTDRVGEYDGENVVLQSATPVKYAISSVAMSGNRYLLLTCTPDRDYGYNYFKDWYISYNDTNTNDVVLNTPLRIHQSREPNSNTKFWLYGDSSLVDHISVAAWDSIWLIPALNNVDTAKTLVVDSVINTDLGNYEYIVHIYDYSEVPSSDSDAYNYNYHTIIASGEWSTLYTPARARLDGNDSAYIYTYLRFRSSADTVSVGDTLYLVKKLQSGGYTDTPQYIAHWLDCQWQAGFINDPNLIQWSEAFDPDSFPALNFVYVDRDDGDIVTAIIVMPFQDYLLVFKKKHISAITVSGEDDILGSMVVNDLVDGIGTPSWASIVSHGRNVYFYDYSGWYVLNGIEPMKISWAIEDISADSVNRDYAHLIVGGYFDKHLWWSYPSGSSTKNNRTVLFNPETKVWTKVDLNLASIYVGLNEDADNGILLGSPDSGVVWRYGKIPRPAISDVAIRYKPNYFDDGEPITASYKSGWFGMEDGYELNKEFKDLQLLLDKHDSTKVYIEMFKDYSSTAFTKDTIGIDDCDILKYRKRTIEGYNLGQRIQIGMTITRIDETFQLPFFKIKWKPIDEVLYDED